MNRNYSDGVQPLKSGGAGFAEEHFTIILFLTFAEGEFKLVWVRIGDG